MLRTLIVSSLVIVGLARSAAAQETAAAAAMDATIAAAASTAAADATVTLPEISSRPAILMPLYKSFVSLQVADFATTRVALARGAREVNPFLSSTGAPGMAVAKLVGTSGTLWLTERLWRRNRRAAVVTMVVSNVVMGLVVVNNTHVVATR